jgi:hypothetical protein
MKPESDSSSFENFKDSMRKLFSVSKADLDAIRNEEAKKRLAKTKRVRRSV